MKLSEIYYKPQKKLFPVINEGFRFKYYAKINSLTCIVGKNGIGKTRFLNSILQNRAGVDLLFNDGTIKFGIEKSQTASPDIDIDRKSVRDIKDNFAIIKYSSAIEYSPIGKNIIGYDVSTSYFLQTKSLRELNRYDVLNQIAVVAKDLEKISELIDFRKKNIKVCLSDEGEAIYRLKDKYLNSYLSKYAEDLLKISDKYKGVFRKKFISILFDELLISDSLNQLEAKYNENPIKLLFNEIDSTNFTVTEKFYELLSEMASSTFTKQVKKFFEVYSLITDASNDFLESGRVFKLYSIDDRHTINGVIEFFYPETNIENCNILYEVFSILSFSWDGLSSGEMSILNLLGRLYSGKKNYGNIPNKLLLVDEVDLGLHPEWQRLWVSDVLPLISEILCSDGQELQVIITTHSPIILSDILNQDIIYLGDSQLQEKTFGQNIYTLFNNSFFLEDVQGKFVSEKLINLSQLLNELSSKQQFELTAENCGRLKDILGLSNITLINDISVFKETLNRLINSIGEEIIRNYFNCLFNKINFYSDDKQNKIEKLKSQLRELEGSEF